MSRNDLHSLYSEQYDAGLRDGLPEEMVGALQATAQAVNPNWSVTHFVWALEPCPVDMAPSSYGEAVAPAASHTAASIDPKASAAVADYLASVGLVVSETNRRAVDRAARAATESPAVPEESCPQVRLQLTPPGRGLQAGLRSPALIEIAPMDQHAQPMSTPSPAPAEPTMPVGPWVLVVGMHRSGTSAVTGRSRAPRAGGPAAGRPVGAFGGQS